MIRQLPVFLIMGIYKAMKSVGINGKMTRLILLTLCAILTDLTSGLSIGKPLGECPPVLPIVCAFYKPGDGCEIMDSCKWNEKCCYDGCRYRCTRISSGIRPVPIFPPLYGPFHPPENPHMPFPYPDPIYPPRPDPLPDYQPDFPGVIYPKDPPNNDFPVFPGGYNFP